MDTHLMVHKWLKRFKWYFVMKKESHIDWVYFWTNILLVIVERWLKANFGWSPSGVTRRAINSVTKNWACHHKWMSIAVMYLRSITYLRHSIDENSHEWDSQPTANLHAFTIQCSDVKAFISSAPNSSETPYFSPKTIRYACDLGNLIGKLVNVTLLDLWFSLTIVSIVSSFGKLFILRTINSYYSVISSKNTLRYHRYFCTMLGCSALSPSGFGNQYKCVNKNRCLT